jgi:hypothetical protein
LCRFCAEKQQNQLNLTATFFQNFIAAYVENKWDDVKVTVQHLFLAPPIPVPLETIAIVLLYITAITWET